MRNARRSHLILLLIVVAVLAWSGWRPYDRLTWWLEVAPGIAGILLLVATYRRFRLTTLCYTLIALHICVLCVGGHYTYARVPVFDWLRPVFGWQRNHYDRLGHFMQGLVPAIIARELFVRLNVLQRKKWLPFLIICVCLAISAFYELIEWWSALISGALAIDFIGSQGDVWDTQGDMFMALIGATCALLFLSHLHDRGLRRIDADKGTAT
ncbi:MAG: putative rane protein [Verrucomicrobiota bacterium]